MIRMTLHVFGYDLRAVLRNRQSQFFALALPVLFLVIFASVFGGGNTTAVAGGQISTSVYYVPGIIAFGVIAACSNGGAQPPSRPLPSSPGAC